MTTDTPLTLDDLRYLLVYNSLPIISTWHVCTGCHMGWCRRYRCVACIQEEIKQLEAKK